MEKESTQTERGPDTFMLWITSDALTTMQNVLRAVEHYRAKYGEPRTIAVHPDLQDVPSFKDIRVVKDPKMLKNHLGLSTERPMVPG